MLRFISLALLVCIASASVNPVQECGTPSGQFLDLRVEECDETPCVVVVGREYGLEVDFVPRDDSQGLTIKLSMILPGIELVVLEAPIAGSGVSGGEAYTFLYNITPSGILVGGTFDLEMQLSDTASRGQIICIRAVVMVID